MAVDWPSAHDIREHCRIVNVEIDPNVSDSYILQERDAVIKHFETATRRQFKAGPPGEVRYFNGSDTGELEIDDYISIQDVQISGILSIGSLISLNSFVEVQKQGFPKNRIYIYSSSLPPAVLHYINKFPMGRANIKITAQWGYAEEIPADVWQSVRNMTCAELVSKQMFDIGGFKTGWSEADVKETYQLLRPSEFLGWGKKHRDLIKLYRRPVDRTIRMLSRRLV